MGHETTIRSGPHQTRRDRVDLEGVMRELLKMIEAYGEAKRLQGYWMALADPRHHLARMLEAETTYANIKNKLEDLCQRNTKHVA